jgi:hypothetical protein
MSAGVSSSKVRILKVGYSVMNAAEASAQLSSSFVEVHNSQMASSWPNGCIFGQMAAFWPNGFILAKWLHLGQASQ